MRYLPRIDEGHSRGLKISDVASDHCHAMHKGGCRDECIALAALVGYMQPGAALCHGGIAVSYTHLHGILWMPPETF